MFAHRNALITLMALVVTALAAATPTAAQELGTLDRALLRLEARTTTGAGRSAQARPLGSVAGDFALPLQAGAASAPRQDSGPDLESEAAPPPAHDLERLALAVGGALAVGALAEYAFGGERFGMNGTQVGAFAGGIVLASWGGIRLGGGRR